MSPASRLEIASLVEGINRRNLDGVSSILHPEFEFHAAISAIEQRVYEGTGGFQAFVADMDTIWDGYRIELTDVHLTGDQAVALMHITGTAKVSGIPLDQEIAELITWRDDSVWRVVAYTSPADAFQAAGLAG